MATTADFRNGLCIVFKDDLYRIVQFQHVKPGKGPAFVRTKLQNIKNALFCTIIPILFYTIFFITIEQVNWNCLFCKMMYIKETRFEQAETRGKNG